MLAELRMELETDNENFGYYQSSNLQGVLMEQLDSAYAQTLHEQGLKPYSQYVLGGGQKEWVIHTMSKEAYQHMIVPLLDSGFAEFEIEKKQIHVNVSRKTLKTVSYQELLDEFYEKDCGRYIRLDILTPASFKSCGRYVNLPQMRYIYQSLMNKYSAVCADMDMYDEETLGQLTDYSCITQYRLKSAYFPVEGVKIPSFKGELCWKVNGSETMARYARLLAQFGEYSGIGIKTAMGMGAVTLRNNAG